MSDRMDMCRIEHGCDTIQTFGESFSPLSPPPSHTYMRCFWASLAFFFHALFGVFPLSASTAPSSCASRCTLPCAICCTLPVLFATRPSLLVLFAALFHTHALSRHLFVPCLPLLAHPGQFTLLGASSLSMPPVLVHFQLDPNQVLFPPSIIKILEQGWQKHIPLHLLTNSRCCTTLFSSGSSGETLSIGDGGKLQLQQPSLDAMGKFDISIAKFYKAWLCLCTMISSFLNSPQRHEVVEAFCLLRTVSTFVGVGAREYRGVGGVDELFTREVGDRCLRRG